MTEYNRRDGSGKEIPVQRNCPIIPRNGKCPCGSGQKFKRCCLELTYATEDRPETS